MLTKMKMLFAFILIVIIANSGNIFANNINVTSEILFTDSPVSSFKTNDNSIDNINQVNNPINTIEFTDNHENESEKPVIKNTNKNPANNERDYNSLGDKTQKNIIGNKANTNFIVNNTITENKTADISAENVANLTATKNQILNNDTLNNDILNDDALNDYTLNNDILNDGALNDYTLNNDILNDGALNDYTLNNDILNDGALNDYTLNNDILNDDALNNNSISRILAADDSSSFSKSSILSAATNVKKFIENNGKLPNYVTIADQKVSMNDFLYLLSKTIVNVNKKSNLDLIWKYVQEPSNPSGNTINGNLNKNDYLTLAQNVVNFIDKNGQAPNYGSTSLGQVQYQTMIYGFARILDFTKNNGVLPNYVLLNTKNPVNLNKIIPKYEGSNENKSPIGSINVSLADIKNAGARVEAFVNTNNGVLPNYVTISGKQYSMAEFLYLASTAIANGVSKDILSIPVKDPLKSNGNSIAGQISKESYVDLASRVSVFIAKNGQAPNYADSPLGKTDFNLLVFGFSKVLRFTETNKVLPNYLTLNKSGSVSNTGTNNIILSEKYNGEPLGSYLAASTNCQVNDAAIKALATELTKGSRSEWAKAESIFNYVRDSIIYNFYFNTKYGAKNTLNGKTGNCVDQSHLLNALFRASGLASRYVNGEATFTSGNTYGHVWTQVKIGDTWVVADTTSSRNSLGVIKNWNTNTAKIYGKYASISF